MSFARSTRGAGPVSFVQAVRDGLAPDGGLYVPVALPRLADGLPDPAGSFADSGRAVARAFLDGELAPEVLDGVVDGALSFPAPLVPLEEGLHLLELFHGPTLAFKDVGARFLARTLAATDDDAGVRTVLVATSGDTGGAVADAFHGVPGHRVVALFPRDGISARQRRQMTTLGGNVRAVAVEGTFDDCQRLAKEAFSDPGLRRDAGLTSANSINLGRLLPQAFYYAHAAARLDRGAAPTWVVPSGNLGNLCAGVLAARAGVPAAGFVAALNRNRVFLDWLEGGPPEAGDAVATLSNAMDVAAPSNLERLRWLSGEDRAALAREVSAVSVDDARTRAAMAGALRRWGRLVDPHTAVGLAAWEEAGRPRPAVVLATAHPAKFPDVVADATGRKPPTPDRLARTLDADERWDEIAPRLPALRPLLLEDRP